MEINQINIIFENLLEEVNYMRRLSYLIEKN